jgi:hypothetical protein
MGVEAPERNVWWRSASFTPRCRLTMPLCQKERHGITLIKVVTNPYSLTAIAYPQVHGQPLYDGMSI